MSETYLCRLCINNCQDYKNLYNINGQCNEVYEMTAIYFHPLFLTTEREANHLPVICMLCWHHIFSFHNFQQSVLLIQGRLLDNENYIKSINQKSNYASENFNTNEITTVDNDGEAESLILPDLQIMEVYPEKPSGSRQLSIDNNTETEEMHPGTSNHSKYIENRLKMSPCGYSSDDDCGGFIEDDEPMGYFTNGNVHDVKVDKVCSVTDLETTIQVPGSNEEVQIMIEKETEDTLNVDNAVLHDVLTEDNEQPTLKRKRKSLNELNTIIAEWRPHLKCVICQRIYPSFSLLQSHFRQVHPNEGCYISCCNLKLRQSFEIEEHIRVHKEAPPNNRNVSLEQNLNCTIGSEERSDLIHCQRTFHQQQLQEQQIISRGALASRLSLHHGQLSHSHSNGDHVNLQNPPKSLNAIDKFIAQWKPELQCDFCQQSFPSFTLLQHHLHEKHPLVCCHRKFQNRSDLVRHKQQCHGTETSTTPNGNGKQLQELDEFIAQWNSNLECMICQKLYPTFTQLQEHFRQDHPTDQCHIVCCQRKLNLRCKIVEHIILDHQP